MLRTGRSGLVFHTLFYADEIRAQDEFRTEVEQVAPRELDMAALLMKALVVPFEPAKYHDRYWENLRALLDGKIQGEERRLGASASTERLFRASSTKLPEW